MANSTAERFIEPVGSHGPWEFDVPVAASTNVYKGTMIVQVTATGGAAPYSTASAGKVIGVAQHDALNSAGALGDLRVRVESGRIFIFDNGTAGDAFADTTQIGTCAFGTDDHTVAKTSSTQTRAPIGFFMGMEPDGRVRVLVEPWLTGVAAASLNPT